MKLTVFNGSPRGEKSNTKILLEQFLDGFTQKTGNCHEEYYLNLITEHARYAGVYQNSEAVLLAFPLYTDAMPGIVKAFIEALKPVETVGYAGVPGVKRKILFMVQSGFPESVHIAAVEKYLIKLARRLDCECLGVIVKGGAEGIQSMPPNMTRKLYNQFRMLGVAFGSTGALDETTLKKLRGMKRFPVWMRPVFSILRRMGVLDFYWNDKLKEHTAFDRRFDRPYAPETGDTKNTIR